jgi:hypothetical protein
MVGEKISSSKKKYGVVNKRNSNKIVNFIDKKFFFSIKPQKKVKNKGWKVKK